jgi:hypothetical protein
MSFDELHDDAGMIHRLARLAFHLDGELGEVGTKERQCQDQREYHVPHAFMIRARLAGRYRTPNANDGGSLAGNDSSEVSVTMSNEYADGLDRFACGFDERSQPRPDRRRRLPMPNSMIPPHTGRRFPKANPSSVPAPSDNAICS